MFNVRYRRSPILYFHFESKQSQRTSEKKEEEKKVVITFSSKRRSSIAHVSLQIFQVTTHTPLNETKTTSTYRIGYTEWKGKTLVSYGKLSKNTKNHSEKQTNVMPTGHTIYGEFCFLYTHLKYIFMNIVICAGERTRSLAHCSFCLIYYNSKMLASYLMRNDSVRMNGHSALRLLTNVFSLLLLFYRSLSLFVQLSVDLVSDVGSI